MSDMRKLMEAIRKIDEADLVTHVPGQSFGVRYPKYKPEEVPHAAKFAVDMALQNNGGIMEDVLSWLHRTLAPLPPEIEAEVRKIMGAPMAEGEGYKVGEPHPSVDGIPADATRLDLGGIQGLEVNRLVSSLQKLGLEQAVHYFIKSGHPSWVKNAVLDQSVVDLLRSYGVSDTDEIDEELVTEAPGDYITFKVVLNPTQEHPKPAIAVKDSQKDSDWFAVWIDENGNMDESSTRTTRITDKHLKQMKVVGTWQIPRK